MKLKQKFTALALCCAIILSTVTVAFADGVRVVTLGANLSEEQKETMLKYFGVNKNEVMILEVNNQEERKYLEGIATEAQLGTKTFSCAYVEPTKTGNGINVKTANITWATSSMVASILATAGMENANVIAAAPFPVSGTGMLTGIMKAFEDATGKPLDEEKKEIASEELVTTGDLGEEIGQDKATGIINDVKTEIIKNDTQDTVQIAETIVNVTNNYNVTLTPEQQKQIEALMVKIAAQDYDYKAIKDTLSNVSDNVATNLESLGESIKNSGILDTIKGWFESIGDWFTGLFDNSENNLGILENTNDELLGENAKIDATDDKAINLPTSEEVEGFFTKIWNWFTGLFNSDSTETNTVNGTETSEPVENTNNSETPVDDTNPSTNDSSNENSSESNETNSNQSDSSHESNETPEVSPSN